MSSLTLLFAAGLALFALAIPLIILYILRVRRKRVTVGSTWLWAAAQRDLMAKSPFKRLYVRLPLILQLLALALIALAFARPALRERGASATHYAVVIDVSASMSTTDADGVTRLDKARGAALEFVDGLPPGAEVMVVQAGRQPRIASPLDRDHHRTAGVLGAIAGEDVVGDLSGAIALSIDRLRDHEGARVMVFTDGYLASTPELTQAQTAVEFVLVGAPVENAALLRVEARRFTDPTTKTDVVEVFTLAANYGSTAREAFVTVRKSGSEDVLDSRRVILPPGDRTPVALTFDAEAASDGDALVVDVSPHDAMSVDDVGYARVPPGEELAVWLLTKDGQPESPWVERAFLADPAVSLKKAAWTGAPLVIPPEALVVAMGFCPPEDLPGGDVLVIHPGAGPCWGLTAGEPVADPVVTSWETGDVRLRFVSFDRLHVTQATPLTGGPRSSALVRADAHVLIGDASTAARTATIVAFDLGESDWPLKASWVLFARNIAEQARLHRLVTPAAAVVPGEPLRMSVPPGTTSIEVLGPDGAPLDASLRSGLAIIPASSRVGVYRVKHTGSTSGELALPVNLVSESESNLSALTPLPTAPTVTARRSEEAPREFLDLAWMAGALGLLALLVELFLFTRVARPREAATPLAKRAA